MEAIRYDRNAIKATLTDEGYLIDSPIVGRAGIQLYKNADGTIRRELRPPEEVFSQDSLDSYIGKPITDEHQGHITVKNSRDVKVGVMLSKGRQDGDNVVADIIIHDAEMIDKTINGGKRELSLGYKVDLDETAGEWNGQQYDAIQRNIRINHLAIVPKGRAGNARLNLDRHDAISYNTDEDNLMSTENLGRIRLDSGLEYQAAPEVVVAFAAMQDDKKTLTTRIDTLQAEVDTVKAERDTLKAQVASADAVRADALKQAREEVKARTELETVAATFKVDCADKTDREVREAVIKAVREDANLVGKSDEYVNAAFDLAVAMRKDSTMAEQRSAGAPRDDGQDHKSGSNYKSFMDNLSKQGAK